MELDLNLDLNLDLDLDLDLLKLSLCGCDAEWMARANGVEKRECVHIPLDTHAGKGEGEMEKGTRFLDTLQLWLKTERPKTHGKCILYCMPPLQSLERLSRPRHKRDRLHGEIIKRFKDCQNTRFGA